MKLTNAQVKNAKPKDKSYKLFDGQGLYIEVPVSGNKRWRMKYRYQGREKRISLGIYPSVTLKEARNQLIKHKATLIDGQDPSFRKK